MSTIIHGEVDGLRLESKSNAEAAMAVRTTRLGPEKSNILKILVAKQSKKSKGVESNSD